VTWLHKGIATVGALLAMSLASPAARADGTEAPATPSTVAPATATPPEPAEASQEDGVVACVRAAEDAQSVRSAHRLRAAFKHLLVCSQSNCPTVIRKDCSYWLAEVEKLLPSVTVQAVDKDGRDLTDVSVTMDGEPLVSRLDGLAVRVDPGARTFRFEHVGSTPIEQTIVIREGQKGRLIRITFDPRPPPPPPRPKPAERRYRVPAPTVVFGAVGVAALGSFGYFGIVGRSDAAELAESCGKNKTCNESQVSPIRTKLLIADVSLGVGLVSLGAATYLFFAGNEQRPPAVSADVALGRQSGRLTLRGRF
jgi:hypothetical protein